MELPGEVELPGHGARLRPLSAEDWALDHALSRVPDVPRWTYYPAELGVEDARERVARSLAQRADGRGARWVVERDGVAVGTLGIVLRVDAPYVYYALLPEGRGAGLATAAVRVVADWVLQRGPEVRAVTMVGNLVSERVLERAAFRRGRPDVEPDGVSVWQWVRSGDAEPTVE